MEEERIPTSDGRTDGYSSPGEKEAPQIKAEVGTAGSHGFVHDSLTSFVVALLVYREVTFCRQCICMGF